MTTTTHPAWLVLLLVGCSSQQPPIDTPAPDVVDAGMDVPRDTPAPDVPDVPDVIDEPDVVSDLIVVDAPDVVTMPIARCGANVYACGDSVDNDRDGRTDADDTQCLGPCDNSEDSYAQNIPGTTGPPCLPDCAFDADTASGNDGCYWSHKCDPREMAPNYYPNSARGVQCAYDLTAGIPGTTGTCASLAVTQSNTCNTVCGPLVPNGCDCFGCCEIAAGSGAYVYLQSRDSNGLLTCDAASVANPTRCQPCTPVAACLNTCETCEICIGKTTLPASCVGTNGQCSTGVQPCGLAGQSPCASGSYCISGCCRPTPG